MTLNLADVGIKGDGRTDNTAAFAKLAATKGLGALYAPEGVYLTRDVPNLPKSLTGDGKQHSIIRALPGTKTLWTARQAAEMKIADVWFDGAGNAETCLDTDWKPTGGAPSVNNSYRDLRVSGYTKLGWTAASNNDCVFDGILVDGGRDKTALALDAPGGAVTLTNAKLFGQLVGRWQHATISGGVLVGLTVTGDDWNVIAMHGGYWYADPTTHANLTVAKGYSIRPSVFTGVHIENCYADGAVIGGEGKVQGALTFTGGHLFGIGAGKDKVALVGPSLKKDGPQIRVRLDGAMVEHLAATNPAGLSMPAASVTSRDADFGGYYRDGA